MSLVWQSPSITEFYRIFDDKCLKNRGIATASVRTGFAMTIFLNCPLNRNLHTYEENRYTHLLFQHLIFPALAGKQQHLFFPGGLLQSI